MSPTCLVLLTDDDKRSFAYNPGCADYFSNTDFEKFDFLHTYSFLIKAHLLTSHTAKNAMLYAMKCAKNKTNIVINLHGIEKWDDSPEIVQHLIANANIIIGNEDEQKCFLHAVNSLKLNQKKQLVITTKGENGAEVSQFGGALYHVPAVKLQKTEMGSTAGAGDAFIAGFFNGPIDWDENRRKYASCSADCNSHLKRNRSTPNMLAFTFIA